MHNLNNTAQNIFFTLDNYLLIYESTLKTKKLATSMLFNHDKSIKNNDDVLTKI